MERWAIYRIHYGLDFLKQSIDSVKDSVDRVFVYYSVHPWVVAPQVTYMNKIMDMPGLHEDVQSFMYRHYKAKQKVHYHKYECNTPANQFSNLYRTSVEKVGHSPRMVIFMEPDMVYHQCVPKALFEELEQRKDIPCLGTRQVELWKEHYWRIPQRDRIGPMVWHIERAPEFNTHFGTWHPNAQFASDQFHNYNFGFCLNERTMLYKHLTAIQFSAEIGDSIPSEEWYEEKWLNWTPLTKDLEISANYKHTIPKAEPYEMDPVVIEQMRKSAP